MNAILDGRYIIQEKKQGVWFSIATAEKREQARNLRWLFRQARPLDTFRIVRIEVIR